MLEEAQGVSVADRIEQVPDGFDERLVRASLSFKYGCFDLGERSFYGREARRIGRQEQDARSCAFDDLSHLWALVDLEVIHHDGLSLLEGGTKKCLRRSRRPPIGGSLDTRGRSDPFGR